MLDIENDDIRGNEAGMGPSQYTDADILVPESEVGTKNDEERRNLTQVLLGKDIVTNGKREEDAIDADVNQEELRYGLTKDLDSFSIEKLKRVVVKLSNENKTVRQNALCNICLNLYVTPVAAIVCWHVHCEQCWLRALGTKKLCPQCKMIVQPKDLRRIYL